MKSVLKRSLMAWLLLLVGAAVAMAALPDDYNPANPPDPNARFHVTTSTQFNAYTSGGGYYTQGTTARISTSARTANYQFDHWLKNGERYTDEQTFDYRVEENARFEAVYRFTPVDPSDPTATNDHRLWLETDTDGSCSFNRTSGQRVEAGTYVYVRAYPSQGYKFKGWFRDGMKLSSSLGFNYYMTAEDTTLSAWFVYNPDNPNDPGGTGQSGVANTTRGDVNGDGAVSTADAVTLVDRFVNGQTASLPLGVADVNSDGTISTADAVVIVDRYVNGDN